MDATELRPSATLPTEVKIDLGGTWLRVEVRRGRTSRTIRRPAVPPEKIAEALRKVLVGMGITHVETLSVGSKGLWKKARQSAVKRSLTGLARKITVMSDVEMTYRNLLGEKPGILLLAGTGSIALARDGKGRWHRAGGLGPKKGDEGSGYWIGREYRTRVLRKKPLSITPANVRHTAALATKALHDSHARDILREAQHHLAALAYKLFPTLGNLKKPKVATFGGVMNNRGFRNGVLSLISRNGSKPYIVPKRHPKTNPRENQ